tara:strand:+ start:247 stop:390 length:144 start_codon:yes stop_codon:yes gene_type:complete
MEIRIIKNDIGAEVCDVDLRKNIEPAKQAKFQTALTARADSVIRNQQ